MIIIIILLDGIMDNEFIVGYGESNHDILTKGEEFDTAGNIYGDDEDSSHNSDNDVSHFYRGKKMKK